MSNIAENRDCSQKVILEYYRRKVHQYYTTIFQIQLFREAITRLIADRAFRPIPDRFHPCPGRFSEQPAKDIQRLADHATRFEIQNTCCRLVNERYAVTGTRD